MATPLHVSDDVGRLGALTIVLMVLIGGCTTARTPSETPAAAPRPVSPASTITPDQRVVAYPNGRWLLFGDGTAASPYGWVWVPTGATLPPPAPPAR